MRETITHDSKFIIYKFVDNDNSIAEYSRNGGELKSLHPYAIETFEKNVFLNTGMNEIWDILIGNSSNVFDATNSRVGVGTDTTEASATDTDLIGTSVYETMDIGYPYVSGNTIYFRGTYDKDTGNQAWNEFVVKNNASGVCFNRKVESKGTKLEGESWILEIQITLS